MKGNPQLPAQMELSVMLKPTGAKCNLNCSYCYYRQIGGTGVMNKEVLAAFYSGYLPRAPEKVNIAWQGGEPTLAGLPFFEQAMALQDQYKRPEQVVANALQTNGTLLDEGWCRFFSVHGFLVRLSLSTCRNLHFMVQHTPEN